MVWVMLCNAFALHLFSLDKSCRRAERQTLSLRRLLAASMKRDVCGSQMVENGQGRVRVGYGLGMGMETDAGYGRMGTDQYVGSRRSTPTTASGNNQICFTVVTLAHPSGTLNLFLLCLAPKRAKHAKI